MLIVLIRVISLVFSGFGFLGREHYNHALSLEYRHLLHLAVFLKVVGETEQKHLALFLEEDRTAAEENVGFHLGTVLKEADGMLDRRAHV